ncbi:MAG: hypothetical protein A2496_05300 [Burkholderiales bacterium RIFOXYC12_FULL_60_6]|nr:MAG: hypothetical protein A2496_05300 [Burkholderiales bacterium RIFOXYC12_FULL_60_6]
MSYATLADILEQLPEADLIGLTDDLGIGEVNQGAVDRAIADADSMIDSYIQARYPAPLSPVPSSIRRIAVDLAVYDLHSRRGSLEIPEPRKDRHKAALRFLEQLAEGKLTLGVAASAPAESIAEIVSSSERGF